MVLGIYVRVSTEEQAEKGISLDNQISRGQFLANKNAWKFKIYKDAGISGTVSFKDRPGLNAMMTDIANKKIGAVFVIDTDRLSRGGIVQTTLIKDIFKQNKIRLFDLNGEIDLNDINQSLLSDMKDLLANFEIKKTGARIATVLEANAAKGKVGGGALLPFGYTKDANKMLVIDKEEKKVVEYIYQLALEGKGTKIISTILNEEGILTKRGRVTTGKSMLVKGEKKEVFAWRDSVIYRILTSSIYMGKRLYKDKYYDCPAIISEATFKLVKDKLSTRNQFKNTTNRYDYQLKGLIQCGTCRGRFYGHKRANGRDNTYICNSQRYSGEWCGNKGINIDYLDKLVIDNILKLEVTTEKAFIEAASRTRQSDNLNDFNRYQNEIAIIDNKLDNLTRMVEDAGITAAVFKKRLAELNSSKKQYQALLEQTRKSIGVFEHEAVIKEFIKQVVSDFKKLKTNQERKLAIQNIVDRITIHWNEFHSEHMIGIFFRLDKLAQYTNSNNELYFMNTEITLERKPDNRIGAIMNERIYLSNAINFFEDDEPLVRADIPYPQKSHTTAQGHSMKRGEPMKVSKEQLAEALELMKDTERMKNLK